MKKRIVKIVILLLFLSTLEIRLEENILSITILDTWRLWTASFLTGCLFSWKWGIRIGEELVEEERIDTSTMETTKPITRREKRRERARRKRANKE